MRQSRRQLFEMKTDNTPAPSLIPITISTLIRKSSKGEYLDITIPLDEYHLTTNWAGDRRHSFSGCYMLTLYKKNAPKIIPPPSRGKKRISSRKLLQMMRRT